MSIPTRNADGSEVLSSERTFFATSSTAQKKFTLQSDRAAQLFVRILYELRVQHRYRLHAFVVMPNHFHALLTVGADMTIEKAMQLIKGGFSFRAGKELQFRAPVWERGFSETRIETADAFERTREYIHNNSVQQHLSPTVEEFPYSSANPRFKLDPTPQGLKPSSFGAAVRHG